MDTTITIPNIVTPEQVATARGAFVDSVGANYGAGRRYAAVLVGLLGTAWITMPHDQKGAEGDAMRTERDALYASLKAAGHSNPSVKWKQIKGYAAELTAPAKPEGETAEGESEGSGNAKQTRSLQLRLIEELTTLYKACKRDAKTLSTEQAQAYTHITSALSALKVDVSKL